MDKFIKSYSSFRDEKTAPKKHGLFKFYSRKTSSIKPISSRLITPNPLNRPKPLYARPKQEKNWRRIILLSIFIGCVLTWLILMIYLPFFQINEVSITGLKTINYDEMHEYVLQKYLRKGLIPLNNYFLIRPGKISNNLSNKYAIKNVEVKKIFPGILSINVTEKISTIIYDNGSSYSLLDGQGMVIKIIDIYKSESQIPALTAITSTTLPEILTTSTTSTTPTTSKHRPEIQKFSSEYGDLPIFYDERQPNIYEKQTDIISPEIIRFIIDWQAQMRSEGIGEVKYFESNNLSAGISVYINRTWKILIQPRNPINQQINNLKVLLTSREVRPTEYVDLRFGERVFWK